MEKKKLILVSVFGSLVGVGLLLLVLVGIFLFYVINCNRGPRRRGRCCRSRSALELERWESSFRRTTRIQWAKEELDEKSAALERWQQAENSSQDLESGGGGIQNVDDNAITHSRQTSKGRLLSLPAELRLRIYSHLHYGDALRLQQVCRFLLEDLPYEAIDAEQRVAYVYHAETFEKNESADRLACMRCLRVRPKMEFLLPTRSGEFEMFGKMGVERRCVACQMEDNRAAKAMQASRG